MRIDAAVVFKDTKKTGEWYRVPEPNESYKLCKLYNGTPWVSADGSHWVPAIGVIINNQWLGGEKLCQRLRHEKEDHDGEIGL